MPPVDDGLRSGVAAQHRTAAKLSAAVRRQPPGVLAAGGGASACAALSFSVAAERSEDRAALQQLRSDILQMQRRLGEIGSCSAGSPHMQNLEAWLAKQEASCDSQRLRLRLTEVYLVKVAQLLSATRCRSACPPDAAAVHGSRLFTDPCDPAAPPTAGPLAMLIAEQPRRAADGDVEEVRRRNAELARTVQQLESDLRRLRAAEPARAQPSVAEQELRKELSAMRRERSELEAAVSDAKRGAAGADALRAELQRLGKALERERRSADDLRASLAAEAQRCQRAEARAQQLDAAASDRRPPQTSPPRFGRRSGSGGPSRRPPAARRGSPQRLTRRSGSAGGAGRLAGLSLSAGAEPHGALSPLSLGSSRGSEASGSFLADRSPSPPPMRDDDVGRDVAELLRERYADVSDDMQRRVAAEVRRDLESTYSECDALFSDARRIRGMSAAASREEGARLREQLAAKDRELGEANRRLAEMQEQFAVGVSLVSETRTKTSQLAAKVDERQGRCEALERELRVMREQAAADRRRAERLTEALRVGSDAQKQVLELQQELDESISARLRLQGCLADTNIQREDFDTFLMDELKGLRTAFSIKLRLAGQEVEGLKQAQRETIARLQDEAGRELADCRRQLREAEERAEHLQRRLRV